MKSVSTEQELKKAVKDKEDRIIIIGELAERIRKDSKNGLKKNAKKAGNIASKGVVGFAVLASIVTPIIPVATLALGIVGGILTKDELKEYEVIPDNTGYLIELKRKNK